jgi:hypothetical protein
MISMHKPSHINFSHLKYKLVWCFNVKKDRHQLKNEIIHEQNMTNIPIANNVGDC